VNSRLEISLREYVVAACGDARAQLEIANKLRLRAEIAGSRRVGWALYWARRAVRSGETGAYHVIAGIILTTKGSTPEAQRELFEVWQAQAEAGDSFGQWQMACCYHDGLGVDKNPELELKWLTAAALNGDEDAIATLRTRLETASGR
jgi:TPR repeat protein